MSAALDDVIDDSISEGSILDTCIDVSSPAAPRPKQQCKLSTKVKVQNQPYLSTEISITHSTHICVYNNTQSILEQDYPHYSFEYFPPKNKQGLYNLTERIRRMGCTQPLWVDITHSKLSKTIELAELLLDYTTVGMID